MRLRSCLLLKVLAETALWVNPTTLVWICRNLKNEMLMLCLMPCHCSWFCFKTPPRSSSCPVTPSVSMAT